MDELMIKKKINDHLHPLSNKSLVDLSANIRKPIYDRSQLTAGIVHIGLGNFHRAHQAWYLHRLMQMGEAFNWAIVGAGVREYDKIQRQKMLKQDFLTTLIELDPKGQSSEIIGSMIDYIPVEDDNASLIKRMAEPDIRIVSLTITEGGYYIDPVTKNFDTENPDIVHDASNPNKPRTAFGAIIAALKIRRAKGIGPFTCQSCDNLQGNGLIFRQTLVSLANLSDPHLGEWINNNCSFPNSMVDCIVPATGKNELKLVNSFGLDDAVPVTHECFRQWVIEDDFCAGRPNWEDVNVTFSNDVDAYEAMKIGILNAGHQILANVGELLGFSTIDECMVDKEILTLFDIVQRKEIIPHIDAVPSVSPEDYLELVTQRFSNPKIKDTVRRVAFDGAARHSGFLHPTIRSAITTKSPIKGLALVEALWARMCSGIREDGSIIENNDPQWDFLSSLSKKSKHDPKIWLTESSIYGDIARNEQFSSEFSEALNRIWDKGCRAVLREYCSENN